MLADVQRRMQFDPLFRGRVEITRRTLLQGGMPTPQEVVAAVVYAHDQAMASGPVVPPDPLTSLLWGRC